MRKKTRIEKLLPGNELTTNSAQETRIAGKETAGNILSGGTGIQSERHAVVLALTGELGSGKTTFLQGFAEGLNISDRIISPTFILVRMYKLDRKFSKFDTFYHIDLYRLEEDIDRQLTDLGFDEIINDPGNIVAVEWADKAKEMFPEDAVWINFEPEEEKKRRIRIG
jgi:tRNA threonylcarbamoyladenosine biosynthesis protein TsaE